MAKIQVSEIQVTVEVEDRTKEQLAMITLNAKTALRAMAEATLARAQMLAPQSDIEGHAGTLRANGRIRSSDSNLELEVVFGGTPDVPYAAYQEFGGDGRRVVRHYTTPGTQAHYLRDAGLSVGKEGIENYL